MGLIAQAMDPTHTVDRPALDVVYTEFCHHWRHFSKLKSAEIEYVVELDLHSHLAKDYHELKSKRPWAIYPFPAEAPLSAVWSTGQYFRHWPTAG